jgi:hypothetical protein
VCPYFQNLQSYSVLGVSKKNEGARKTVVEKRFESNTFYFQGEYSTVSKFNFVDSPESL